MYIQSRGSKISKKKRGNMVKNENIPGLFLIKIAFTLTPSIVLEREYKSTSTLDVVLRIALRMSIVIDKLASDATSCRFKYSHNIAFNGKTSYLSL